MTPPGNKNKRPSKSKEIEEKLCQSEERYRLLHDTMLQGVVFQDADGKMISMNPAAERILARTPEGFNGSPVGQEHFTIHEDGTPFPGLDHPAMVALRTGREVRDVVMGVYDPGENEHRWIIINAVPLFRPGEDRPYQVYTTFNDITERKKMEEALEHAKDELEKKVQERTRDLSENEEKYRTIVDNAQEGIMVARPDGQIVFVNRRMAQTLGYAVDELIGTPSLELVVDADRTKGQEKIRERDTGIMGSYEIRIRRKDGGAVHVLINSAPVYDAEGRHTLNIAMLTDITDIKRAEAAVRDLNVTLEQKVQERTSELSESEAKYRGLFDNLQEGVSLRRLVYDEQGEIVDSLLIDANPALLRSLGASTIDEVKGKRDSEIMSPEMAALSLGRARRTRTAQRPITEDVHFDASGRDYLTTSIPLGENHLIFTSVDITERKKAEDSLKESEKLSTALNQINAYINYTLDYKEIMQRVLEEGARALNAESSLINMREGDHWVARSVHNFPPSILGQLKADEESPTSMLVMKERKAVAIDDAYNDPRVDRQAMKSFNVRSVLVIPILLRDEIIGIIAFYYHSKKVHFGDAQIDFANKLAGSLSLAIKNARQYEEIKNAEDRVRRQNAILEGINRIFRETIVSETNEDLGLVCLDVAENITKSKFGFIGQLNSRGYLDDDAISNPGWEACSISAPKGHGRLPTSMNVHGIYGRVITAGKAFFTNDPGSHPDSIGVPKGHPPLTAFLGVPLKSGDRVIGMVGLGNKEGGYDDDDLRAVEALAPAIVEALHRKRTEEALKESVEMARRHAEEVETLMDVVPAAIWVAHDPECRVITGNQAADQFYESSEDENVSAGPASGEEWDRTRRFFHDGRELRPEELPMQVAAREGVEVRDSELEVLLPSRRKITMLGNARPLLDTEGKVRGSVASFIDITGRKRAEEELQATKARLEAILNQMPVGITVIEPPNGRIIYQNAEVAKLFRHELFPTEGIEEYEKWQVFNLDGSPVKAEDHIIGRSLLEGIVIKNRVEKALRGDGSYGYLNTTSAPVRDNEGNIIAAIAMNIDVTEQYEAERELARSNAELQQFAYVASHDLQEPLRMVTAYLSLLEKRYGDQLDGKAKEYMDFAVEGGLRARDLVRDLLEISRLDAQAKVMSRADMNEVMDKACSNLAVQINEEQATVTSDPLPTIMADGAQMTILLQNLISNAIKFHGDMEPKIHVSCENKGQEWLFSVRDNGIGIDPQFKDKIFIIFQRLHSREEYEGTGIGLAIAKKIVESHGGRIWFESQFGQGTTFYFTIPKAGRA